ncbi:LysR family transcriptional regulator [Methylobacterium nodulans]|uniref:Transcriptional regulator, LysR family n=1 Tax=Methylobacterium nodulans (strain LMG 21967 / CNCM I-2342 / ORS 2060) TaxID=460265 RepID=B8IVM7_METNO|nr:LysR family transcriptional regulator [Methylobacterium nodulans]ACL62467.1 transcriptional regulator, LysR family [Methylobacterium nodulans ORS 2060]
MLRESLNDLFAFIAVARTGSFTRAAAQLGVSQPALSQTVRGLEARLGVRLLTRTTRSVAPTEAGERLLKAVGPRFAEIEAGLAMLAELRGKPAGTVRITATEHAANTVLWPTLKRVLPEYPDIKVEIAVDYGLTDIVAERFDAGVRYGGTVAKDMTAVRIGPDVRMAAVAAPAYFAGRSKPERPEDLTIHDCINLRLPTRGGLYAWEFEKDGRELRVWVEGQLVFNTVTLILLAALDGFGIAYLPEDGVQAHLDTGALVRVLEDWCEPFSGYHIYYPSRRQPAQALAVLVEALRWKSDRVEPARRGQARA